LERSGTKDTRAQSFLPSYEYPKTAFGIAMLEVLKSKMKSLFGTPKTSKAALL
jgi:hypothetical protein